MSRRQTNNQTAQTPKPATIVAKTKDQAAPRPQLTDTLSPLQAGAHALPPSLRHASFQTLQKKLGNGVVQRIMPPAQHHQHRPFPLTKRPPQQVQRFGSQEHQQLGNRGSDNATYDLGGGTAAAPTPFSLSHGDIVALSGDYFDPRDTRTNPETGVEEPNPHALFRYVNRPSTDPGKQVGTQDEIIYTLYHINARDSRFTPGGQWHALVGNFSQAVKDAVNSRYLELAANNTEHFVAPEGSVAGPESGLGSSAGGSYRSLHEDAIYRAFLAGQDRQPVQEAMMREAAAQHFLTDYFAAGHLRTPRQSIRTFWAAKYPLFFANLKKKIALDVAIHINENTTNAATIFGSVQDIYNSILTKVNEATADVPPMGFDDLVSLIAHDFDNEQGLWVVNDIGERWLTLGDGSLNSGDPNNRTAEMAQLSVRLGNTDIDNAFQLGQSTPGPMQDRDWVLQTIKGQAAAPAAPRSNYAPEQIFPRLDPDKENGVQSWQADSFDALWEMKIRSDREETYGQEMTKSVQDGELKHQLEGMGSKFPESEAVEESGIPLGTVHPRAGYLQGFLQKIIDNPRTGLRSIIDFDPSVGQSFNNTDDIVMEEMSSMNDEELRGLTLNQRSDRIKQLIGGVTVEAEGENVIKLFETATAGDRAQLYRMVEGHAWTGDWIEGIFVDDDDIYNALYSSQLSRLKTIINGE